MRLPDKNVLVPALGALIVSGVAWSVGYQPNLIRNLVGPITVTGSLSASDDLTASDDVTAGDDVTATDDLISTDDVLVGDDLAVDSNDDVCLNGSTCTARIRWDTAFVTVNQATSISGTLQTTGELRPLSKLINSGTSAACSSNTGAVCVDDAAGLAIADGSGTTVATITAGGLHGMPSTDSTGTAGAATINKPSGRSSVAAAAASVTITNSLVTATSNIQITPLARSDSDCDGWYISAVASGSFTLTCPAGSVVANWPFMWVVLTAI